MSRHPLEVQGAKSEKRFLQPRAEIFRPTPTSIAFVAISTGGKTSQMLTVANVLYPIMDRIVLFSSSHKLDPAWTELKDKVAARNIARGEHPDTHPFTFTNLTQLDRVVQEQVHRVMEAKENDEKHIPQMLIILDDLLGSMKFSAQLDALVTRGRHAGISVLASTQVYRGLSQAQRKNFAGWCLGKMAAVDWKVFEDEHAGSFVTRDEFRRLYARATAQKYGFLYYRPRSGDVENMFYSSFTEQLVPT